MLFLGYEFEARLFLSVYFDLFGEHRKRSRPERAVAVKLTINDQRFFGFGMPRGANYLILAAFIMTIATGNRRGGRGHAIKGRR